MKMYGIARIDHEASHTHAWRVTISRKNRMYLKPFSDGIYGGKQEALAAAIAYRDEIISNCPPMTIQEFCSIVKRNNRSGISGVCRCANRDKKNKGKERWYWIARWSPEPGKTKQKKFSVAKYGEEEARQKAIQYREYVLTQLDGYFNPGMSKKRG